LIHRVWLLLLSLTAAVSIARADERILSWQSDIRVRPDSTLEVTETLRVRSEGERIRRGILRDFPTTYVNRRGERVVTGFDVLLIRRDGQPESHRTERLANGVRIWIGDPEVFLAPGLYTYTITYRTDRQLGSFAEHDELYWNVTGNGWDFPIDDVTAQVFLPGNVPADAIAVEAYTGPQGDRGRDWAAEASTSTATFRTTRALGPREGLTIVAGWPKGYVTAPTGRMQVSYLLRDAWPAFIGVAGLLLLIGYYVRAWHEVGRDPPSRVIVPRYEAPEGQSPASMRFLRRMKYDDRSFAAAVLSLAVKGALRIEQESGGLIKRGGKFTLHRMEPPPGTTLSEDETVLRDTLLGSRSSIELDNANHVIIAAAKLAHLKLLGKRYTPALFRINGGWHAAGIALSLLLGAVAIVLPAVKGGFGASWWFATKAGWVAIGAAALALFVNGVFGRLLKAPTVAGRAVMDHIEGFRLYLDVAEGDDLRLIDAPPLTVELYERNLPAALALEVEQHWAERFAGVFATQAAGHAPAWYSGDAWDSRHVSRFSSSFGSAFSSAISSSSTAPGSSSGSGGGGSSGGGGGGGGGGGW
jgi:uncharacterized membrane protein YgcG